MISWPGNLIFISPTTLGEGCYILCQLPPGQSPPPPPHPASSRTTLVLLGVLVVHLELDSTATREATVFSAVTSTTTIHAQCSLPDLKDDHPRPMCPCRTSTTTMACPVKAAGPQPRQSTPSASLLDLNREYPREVFPAGPHVGRYVPKNVQTTPTPECQKECQKIPQMLCQIECQLICQRVCQQLECFYR